MKPTTFLLLALLVVPMFATSATATVQDIELRLDSSIQYPNDRPMVVMVEAMAFENDKPSRSQLSITVEIRWPNGTIAQEMTVSAEPGIDTPLTFSRMKEVGVYFVMGSATAGDLTSDTQVQRTRVTYAPQEYTAGFLDKGRFMLTVLDDESSITVTEYLDNGYSITEGRSFNVGNGTLDVEVPMGYMAVRYNVIDEHGWMNYERATSGITVHGTPYVWLYGDLTRIEPVASFVSWASIAFGIVGGSLVLVGAYRYYGVFADERAARRKELGIENSPSWLERQRINRNRRQSERDYNQRRPSRYGGGGTYDDYRGGWRY
jgi:hypothetical protein